MQVYIKYISFYTIASLHTFDSKCEVMLTAARLIIIAVSEYVPMTQQFACIIANRRRYPLTIYILYYNSLVHQIMDIDVT